MAYMNQERKAKFSGKIAAILKEYSLKGTLSVRNNMTIVLKIKSGKIDFIKNYNEQIKNKTSEMYLQSQATDNIKVNSYWYDTTFSGTALECIQKIMNVLNEGNHDNSDIQTDYFDVGWYVDVYIGSYNKPYVLIN